LLTNNKKILITPRDWIAVRPFKGKKLKQVTIRETRQHRLAILLRAAPITGPVDATADKAMKGLL
jgi:hypothetical protein